MNYSLKSILTVFLSFMVVFAFGQNPNEVEMADVMRDNGKIYVVVGVLLLILLGMFSYLITLNRKLSKLEKELKD